MAAITTLDTFGGSSDPLTTGDGWTIFEGTGFSEGSGYATPKSYAADQGMVWSTAFTEDGTNFSTGLIAKWEFDDSGSNWTDGAVWRGIVRYQDANNYDYVKIMWGGLSIYTDLNDDGVELWTVRSGTHTQMTADSGVYYKLSAAGHLGHYQLQNRSTTFYPSVTLLCMRDMYAVMVSAKDPYHNFDQKDFVVMWARATPATYAGKVGLYSVAGTQTVVCRSVQAQLVNLKWVAKTGSDSNAGTYTAPYLTLVKAVAETSANEYAVVRVGSYTETLSYASHTIPLGTSTEDRPRLFTYGNEVVTFRASGTSTGCINVRGDYSYRGWHGFDFDGAYARDNTDVIKLWAQAVGGSGATTKYWEFSHCLLRRPHGLNCLFIGQGTFYSGSSPFDQSPTTSEYEQFHHVHRCEFKEGSPQGSSNPGGGIYNEASKCVFEYFTSHNHGENGGRSRYGTSTGLNGVKVTNNNITRFAKLYNNEQYGWYVGSGANNVMDYILSYSNGTTDGSGLAVLGGADTTYVRWNVTYDNGKAGTEHGNIAIELSSTSDIDGPVIIDHNVSYGGKKYGIAALDSGSGTPGTYRITNNVDRSNGTTDFFTNGSSSWATDTNNHDSNDSDPLWNDPANGDFTLQNVSSPLVEGGSVESWTLPYDFGRRPVPQDNGSNAADIGPYEYPEPNANDPAVTLPSTFSVTINVPKVLVGVAVNDDDGDIDEVWGIVDNETSGFSATESGGATFVGADAS